MRSRSLVLGLITTGQGPRDEYVRYNRAALDELDIHADVRIRHALDGLAANEIESIRSGPGEPVNGCFVDDSSCIDQRYGAGRKEVWIHPTHLVQLFQHAVDELESDGVDATILCCAEEPAGKLRSSRFLVLPWMLLVDTVRALIETLPTPRLGVLIPDTEHRVQDQAIWTSQPWMSRLSVIMEPRQPDLDRALGSFRRERIDLGVHWGYGRGLAPGDPSDWLSQIERMAGAPFITPQYLAVQAVSSLVRS